MLFYPSTKTKPIPVPRAFPLTEQGSAVPCARQAPPALRNKGRLLGCPCSTGRWLRALGHKQPTAEVSHKALIVTATGQCQALGHCGHAQGSRELLQPFPSTQPSAPEEGEQDNSTVQLY